MSTPTASGTPLFLLLSLAVTLCAANDGFQSPEMAIMKEIGAANGSSVISLGMVDVLSEAPLVMDFLKAHNEYTSGFGGFAAYAVDLATRFLEERVYDFNDPLSGAMHRFMKWISALKLGDRFVFDLEHYEYVGPGADPTTEDLRAIVRLLNSRTPEVPADPFEGGEVNILSQLFARHLHVLAFVSATPNLKDDEELSLRHGRDLTKQVRILSALYRLSFRQRSMMHLSEIERSLIVEYIQDVIKHTRQGVEDGTLPASYWEHVAEASKRFLVWKEQRELEEL